MNRTVRALAATTLAGVALTLASCSTSAEDSTSKGSGQLTTTITKATKTTTASPAADTQAQTSGPITFAKGYMKAKGADKDMTAIFGEITNNTDEALQLVSVSSTDPKLAGMLQLHVVENGKMKEADGGFAIDAHQSLTLKPGGAHIMLMNNTQDLQVGDTVAFTLHFSNGQTAEVTVPILVQASGEESYGDIAPTTAAMQH